MSTEEIIGAVVVIITAFFGFKYREKRQRNNELSAQVEELQLNEKLSENKASVENHFAGSSDDDVLDEAIKSGKKLK